MQCHTSCYWSVLYVHLEISTQGGRCPAEGDSATDPGWTVFTRRPRPPVGESEER